ncbi:MAG: zinc transporter ZupT [Myxococcota bacterium]
MGEIGTALLLTLAAGLSTAVGALWVVLRGTPTNRWLAAAYGFSAGVMLYISFAELLVAAQGTFVETHGERYGSLIAASFFLAGIIGMGCFERVFPEPEVDDPKGRDRRIGWLTAAAVMLHNFPEGIATFTSSLGDVHVGMAVALAIAVHNIPEGIAVAAPVHRATGSRRIALAWGLMSGLAEPIGGLAAYLFLRPWMSEPVIAGVDAVVGGIMVYVSIHVLMPQADRLRDGRTSFVGPAAGMAAMALSLAWV